MTEAAAPEIASPPRFGAAFVFAAVAVAVTAGLVSGSVQAAPYAFWVAAGHALMLGLPAYLLLSAYRPIRLAYAGAAGFLIGAVPFGLVTTQTAGSDLGVDEVVTGAGWAAYVQSVLTSGGFGAIGGLAFWAAMRGLRPGPSGRLRWLVALVLLPLSVALIMSVPRLTADRSYYDLPRGGAEGSLRPMTD